MKTGFTRAAGAVAAPVLVCCGLAGIGAPALAAQATCRAGSIHFNGSMTGVAADSATTAWAVGWTFGTGKAWQ